jgi:hypothetical protein
MVASMADRARAMQIFALKMDEQLMVVMALDVRTRGLAKVSARPDVCSCFVIG